MCEKTGIFFLVFSFPKTIPENELSIYRTTHKPYPNHCGPLQLWYIIISTVKVGVNIIDDANFSGSTLGLAPFWARLHICLCLQRVLSVYT